MLRSKLTRDIKRYTGVHPVLPLCNEWCTLDLNIHAMVGDTGSVRFMYGEYLVMDCEGDGDFAQHVGSHCGRVVEQLYGSRRTLRSSAGRCSVLMQFVEPVPVADAQTMACLGLPLWMCKLESPAGVDDMRKWVMSRQAAVMRNSKGCSADRFGEPFGVFELGEGEVLTFTTSGYVLFSLTRVR